MSRLIYYYNVGVYYKNIKTNINFADLLSYVNESVSWNNRVRKLDNSKIASAFPFKYQNDGRIMNVIVPMGQFRQDYQPKIGNVSDPDLKEIRELESNADIVELSTFVYDEYYRLLILEHNPNGLKKGDIEKYFSSFFKNSDYIIKLDILELDNDIERVLRSNQIRLLEIYFNTDSIDDGIVLDNASNDYKDCILDIFAPVEKGFEFLSSQTGGLVLKANYNNSSSMDVNNLKLLIKSLNINHSAFESIKIRYRDSRTDKLSTIDLKKDEIDFKMRILKNSQVENPGSEYIGVSIIESKLDNLGIIHQNFQRFIKDIESNLEYKLDLTYIIPELYKV